MDRQHPRDLFDVRELFAHGGITPEIRRAFVVYLASHNRTIHEVLFPTPKDIRLAFEGSFVGMTTEPVTLEALLATRERLFRELPSTLDANEREFLRTLVRADPDWSLLGIPHLEELPAIRWRLQNLQELARTKPQRFRALAASLDAQARRASVIYRPMRANLKAIRRRQLPSCAARRPSPGRQCASLARSKRSGEPGRGGEQGCKAL